MVRTVNAVLTTDLTLHAIGDVIGGRIDLSALVSRTQESYITTVNIHNWLNAPLDIRVYMYDGRHSILPGIDNAALAFNESQFASLRFFHQVEFEAADYFQSGTGLQAASHNDLWLPIPPTNDPVYAIVEARAPLTPSATGKIHLNFASQVLTRP